VRRANLRALPDSTLRATCAPRICASRTAVPRCRAAAKELLSLPLYPELTEEEIDTSFAPSAGTSNVMNEREYASMHAEEESHWWYAGMRSIVLSLLPPDAFPAEARFLTPVAAPATTFVGLRDNYHARTVGLDFHPRLCLSAGRAGARGWYAEMRPNSPFSPDVRLGYSSRCFVTS